METDGLLKLNCLTSLKQIIYSKKMLMKYWWKEKKELKISLAP